MWFSDTKTRKPFQPVEQLKIHSMQTVTAMTMDLQQPADKKVIFCPVSSLYPLSVLSEEEDNMLVDCFAFSEEVEPGWIEYNPQKITAITSNDMFRPMTENSRIIHSKKQLIRVRNQEDISTFEGLLEKPVLMCATRRQYCGTSVNVSPPDTENYRKHMVSGFDIDFAIIFPPDVLKQALEDTLKLIRLHLTNKRKFCLMIDLKRVLKELIPQELQAADSLEYVSWHNTAFWITNHCKPHQSLMYVNNRLFWTALFPFAIFAALPYRAGRRLLCRDERLSLRYPMEFKVGARCDDEKVVVCVWCNDPPPPGKYNKYNDRYTLNTTKVECLEPLMRSSDMITFDFSKEVEY